MLAPVVQVSGVEILPERAPQVAGPQRPAHDVRLDGSVLLVDGRPFFRAASPIGASRCRCWQKPASIPCGLRSPPTPEILAEAQREGLWLLAPPPRQLGRTPGDKPVVAPIGPEYDPVLAWHLGDSLTSAELADTTALVRQLHLADIRNQRPILCVRTPTYGLIADRSTCSVCRGVRWARAWIWPTMEPGCASGCGWPGPARPFGPVCKRRLPRPRASSNFCFLIFGPGRRRQ